MPKRKNGAPAADVAQTAPQKRRKAPRGRPFKAGNTLGKRFQKGVSGNPGGRPATVKETQTEAAGFAIEAVAVLVEGMRQKKDPPERRHCAVALLDRACGKPAQPIVGDDDGDPMRFETEGLVGLLKKLAGESTE